jgi:hypothetical protein
VVNIQQTVALLCLSGKISDTPRRRSNASSIFASRIFDSLELPWTVWLSEHRFALSFALLPRPTALRCYTVNYTLRVGEE